MLLLWRIRIGPVRNRESHDFIVTKGERRATDYGLGFQAHNQISLDPLMHRDNPHLR